MIERSTLRAQIAVALRDEILAGRLPTGRQFTVKEIAEQYGVSATPVREALVDLSAQGLLDVEQHRGFRVHEFTSADYRAMVEARTLVLEGLFHGGARAGTTVEEAGDPGRPGGPGQPWGPDAVLDLELEASVLASVRRRADAARRAARAGDLDVLIGYDLRYWRELAGIVGNPYISDFLDRLRVQCWVFAVPDLRRAGEGERAERLWAGHRELLDAVESRDAAAARRIVTAYHHHSLQLAP